MVATLNAARVRSVCPARSEWVTVMAVAELLPRLLQKMLGYGPFRFVPVGSVLFDAEVVDALATRVLSHAQESTEAVLQEHSDSAREGLVRYSCGVAWIPWSKSLWEFPLAASPKR